MVVGDDGVAGGGWRSGDSSGRRRSRSGELSGSGAAALGG